MNAASLFSNTHLRPDEYFPFLQNGLISEEITVDGSWKSNTHAYFRAGLPSRAIFVKMAPEWLETCSKVSCYYRGAMTKGKTNSNIRVVIADDHAIFREGLRKLLEGAGDISVVGEAADGNEALHLLDQLKPDVLLLDLRMPVKDGLGVLEEMNGNAPHVRVILVTEGENEHDVVRAMRLGARGVVWKQSASALLLKSIRKVNAGEIWLDNHMTAEVIDAFKKTSDAGVRREKPLLSPREREIVQLVAQGFRNREIAEKLFISEQTVKNHLHNIFDKLGVSDRLELALYAIHHRLTETP